MPYQSQTVCPIDWSFAAPINCGGQAGGERSVDAVWTFEAPYAAESAIRQYLAFYPDRVDAIEVDSEGCRPQRDTCPERVDIVGHPSFTNIFPKFSPLNSLRKAAGAFSMPWSTVSLHVTLPSCIQEVISLWNSGMKSR
jgi:hypothetical protein